MNARQFKSLRNNARTAKSSLQGTFAKFANSLIMTGREKRYSIVKDAVFVVLEEEKIFSIVIRANVA